ncbi:MAG: M48 family metallopeptidase [Verrucomicrobia bacterium]|nr:M48 family metallopeptidase [Verrucomicrobiota bacterium]
MDFFERQDRARRVTGRLIVYFGSAVVLIALSVYLVLALVFLQEGRHDGSVRLWEPGLFAGAVLGTLTVIGLGSLAKILELSRGGATVAIALGGRPLDTQSRDPDERRLLNVVEEMAIASGVPVPEVYLLEREGGINAFAAGYAPRDAVIGVTRGCLRLLGRDELQGVIAHEFSHILNGDMRLNLRLIGLLNGILCLALIGRVMLRMSGGRGSGRKGGNPLPLIGLVLLVFGAVGLLFGRLIKSAVSRQRELLADAAAVQFTRNPDGLLGALKKIGGLAQGSDVSAPRAEEASHLFFGNALSGQRLSWFATHPPLLERIRVWEPAFDGVYPVTRAEPPRDSKATAASPRASGVERLPPLLRGAAATVAVSGVLAQAGQPTIDHLAYARALVAGLPRELREATDEPMAATALVYALMLSGEPERREAQMELLGKLGMEPVLFEVRRLMGQVESIGAPVRLPVIELCLPALRRMSPGQFAEFERAIGELVTADGQIEIHEYALRHMVRRHLEPQFRAVRRPVVQYYVMKPLLPDLVSVLSVLAHAGHETPETVTAAFAVGMREVETRGMELRPTELAHANLAELDAALGRMVEAAPTVKRQLLRACAATVSADGRLETREAELLRAIADALDCPVPPFLALQ